MSTLHARSPQESITILTELVLPAQANLLGNLLGGQLMHFMDIAGALTCRRHSGYEVATVAVDKLEFKHPIKVGEVITITSKLIWVGNTSMKVKIDVSAEDTKVHVCKLTNTAYMTFVALDSNCKPVKVPPLAPQTDEEKALFEREQKRYLEFKKSRK
ncbi:thioesterase superfamily protein [[Clostridium] cellulosi]|uniref:Thioesterase superfamily protein n=1 Tax=[Clostridium] cellulosi TaxID=29343 RepID=A0A078KPA9_9FIRM|nr:MAG: acyl-CoA thioesterase [[Clostridium] cellulosi]CDZ24303.1 thioesterase superfamily protein [[Clostridium] cellulosi]